MGLLPPYAKSPAMRIAVVDEDDELTITAGRAYLHAAWGSRRRVAQFVRVRMEAHNAADLIGDDSERHVAYITGAQVPEELRRRGIGTVLVRRLLAELHRRRVGAIWLHADASEAYWVRFGFRVVLSNPPYPLMRLGVEDD